MSDLAYSRRDEQLDTAPGSPLEVDPSPLVGHWINTNGATAGIAKVTVARDDEGVLVSVWPATGPPAAAAFFARADAVYSNAPTATAAMALTAGYEDERVATRLEANLSLGLLVIATCHTFKGGSGRSNYFSREFFYYAGTPPLS